MHQELELMEREDLLLLKRTAVQELIDLLEKIEHLEKEERERKVMLDLESACLTEDLELEEAKR